MKKKLTSCTECTRKFWYYDPRPGGRPRQKCGICSSRPPRYPWSFVDPNAPVSLLEDVYIPEIGAQEGLEVNTLPPVVEPKTSSPVLRRRNGHSIGEPAPKENARSEPLRGRKRKRATSDNVDANVRHEAPIRNSAPSASYASVDLSAIESRLDRLESRIEQIEEQLNSDKFVKRNDWMDISYRLDFVEQESSKTIGQVRSRLENFSKEVRQIAVIPEQELSEMYDLIKMLRHHLLPDQHGNRSGNMNRNQQNRGGRDNNRGGHSNRGHGNRNQQNRNQGGRSHSNHGGRNSSRKNYNI